MLENTGRKWNMFWKAHYEHSQGLQFNIQLINQLNDLLMKQKVSNISAVAVDSDSYETLPSKIVQL